MEILKEKILNILKKIITDKNINQGVELESVSSKIFNTFKNEYEISLRILNTCLMIEQRLKTLLNLAENNCKNWFMPYKTSCPLFFINSFETFLRKGTFLHLLFESFYRDPCFVSLDPESFFNLTSPMFSKALGTSPPEIGFFETREREIPFFQELSLKTINEFLKNEKDFLSKLSQLSGKNLMDFPEKNSLFGGILENIDKRYERISKKFIRKAKFHFFKFKKKNRLIKKKLLLIDKRLSKI